MSENKDTLPFNLSGKHKLMESLFAAFAKKVLEVEWTAGMEVRGAFMRILNSDNLFFSGHPPQTIVCGFFVSFHMERMKENDNDFKSDRSQHRAARKYFI
ncbi:hypothetical protein [Paenibacillus sp. DMB20]|uniref:hypothetical protein n=1 Tax=Paenibacillus sp. DMB20 TaxID=1642570 RepID=UPI000627C6E1|nr:hypothetical protein [Paenibacillus sp. DMB20]KKO52944.1 hypothetical protein XI25_17275 [Paenibacillus sp. DMB20]KKO53576.1 hypothetical protein XI25_11200 [Paenibacillus sp. DMB20]